MYRDTVSCIKPVLEAPVQAFYTDRIQLFDVMNVLLHQLNDRCRTLYITSFSISEEFIRKIVRFRSEMQIGCIVLLLDTKAAAKVSKLLPFTRNVFDKVYLTNNHGKVILFDAGTKISICTSQNQTRGNRREATIITTDAGCYNSFLNEIETMIKTGIRL
ncbi:hypothetical protein FACS189414_4780 [Bacteroidia bacterium]|nr:hypothetical protein FACS189414_4780 [Bacteroidia bacterium]